MIVQLLTALFILSYFVFSAVTVYFVFIGKRVADAQDFIGKLIWWHGCAVILVLICVCVGSLSLITANVIVNAMSIQVLLW